MENLHPNGEPSPTSAQSHDYALNVDLDSFGIEPITEAPVAEAPTGKLITSEMHQGRNLDTTIRSTRLFGQVLSEAQPLTPEQVRAAFKQGTADIASPCTLNEVLATFRRYLYIEDDSIILMVLASVAANLMDGDPLWLMLIGASSGGKTEFLNPLRHLNFVREAATLTEASLLSGTSKGNHAANAKGGLLKEMGSFGIILAKDFTSLLSMRKEGITAAFAALREIYDGSWTRRVGSDGGQELSWKGKMALIACCTEAIDQHHAVVGAMGERFVFFRLPSVSRKEMARQALRSTGSETEMREALHHAVAGFFAQLDVPPSPAELDDLETERLVALADLASRCRSGVQRDSYSRNILMAQESEYPTRLIKILLRLYSGLIAIGVDRPRAWFLVTKTALDSMHKTRREVFGLLVKQRGLEVSTKEIGDLLNLPDSTVRRALEDLAIHQVIQRAGQINPGGAGGSQHTWCLRAEHLATLEQIFATQDWDACVALCFPNDPVEVSQMRGQEALSSHTVAL